MESVSSCCWEEIEDEQLLQLQLPELPFEDEQQQRRLTDDLSYSARLSLKWMWIKAFTDIHDYLTYQRKYEHQHVHELNEGRLRVLVGTIQHKHSIFGICVGGVSMYQTTVRGSRVSTDVFNIFASAGGGVHTQSSAPMVVCRPIARVQLWQWARQMFKQDIGRFHITPVYLQLDEQTTQAFKRVCRRARETHDWNYHWMDNDMYAATLSSHWRTVAELYRRNISNNNKRHLANEEENNKYDIPPKRANVEVTRTQKKKRQTGARAGSKNMQLIDTWFESYSKTTKQKESYKPSFDQFKMAVCKDVSPRMCYMKTYLRQVYDAWEFYDCLPTTTTTATAAAVNVATQTDDFIINEKRTRTRRYSI